MSTESAKALFYLVVISALSILFVGMAACGPEGHAQTTVPAEERRTISEKLVAQIDDSTLVKGSLAVSPDSRRLAYVAKADAKAFVVVDGKEQKHYDDIGRTFPIFTYDEVCVGAPIFSPDSRRMVYVAREQEKWFVVVDGKEEKHYDDIGKGVPSLGAVLYMGTPIFSQDSRRLAYVAKVGEKMVVVVDGQEQKAYDDIGGGTLIFSPNSRRVAYAVAVGAKQSVVVDGKEGKPYDWIGALLFSPDSRRVAYMAGVDGRKIVVVDGKKAKPYDGVAQGEGPSFWQGSPWVADTFYGVVFSPDSRRVAYAAGAGARRLAVVDGKEEEYSGSLADDPVSLTDDPTFSPDSRRLAYAAWSRKNDSFVVVDGKKEKSYHHIAEGSVLFSPDSRRLAYMAQQDEKWCVVVDGKEEKPYDGIYFTTEINFGQWNEGPIFSPDSRRVAYIVAVGAKQSVVVDGKEGKPYDGLTAGSLIFSPDSRRVAYGAKAGAKAFVVVDGKEGRSYDGLVKGTTIVFNSANALNYLADKRTIKGLDVYLVEETID